MKVKNTPDGLVIYNPKTYQTIRFTKEESKKLGIKELAKDTPPEVVHLEISDRCNLNCPYCYVKDKSNRELTTETWEKIIKELVDNGVFQVTFGGGEPTMRKDLHRLASYARNQGLTICMTSNGLNIPKLSPLTLKLFDQINISYHEQEGFEEALVCLKENNVKRGINFCFSKSYQSSLELIRRIGLRQDAEILFLSYKPVNNDFENQIPPKEVYQIAKTLHETGSKVAIDGLTCGTCLASKRFCDIDSLGNVMVCSFLREPAGNLTKQSFKEIWGKRNKVIKCPYLLK